MLLLLHGAGDVADIHQCRHDVFVLINAGKLEIQAAVGALALSAVDAHVNLTERVQFLYQLFIDLAIKQLLEKALYHQQLWLQYQL